MAREYRSIIQWSAHDLEQAIRNESDTLGQVADRLPDDQRAEWNQHINALDNLLTLFGLSRHANVFGRGFLIYHPSKPTQTRWVSATASEESWLEDVKLLAK